MVVGGRCAHAFGDVCCGHLCTDDVVEQDVREGLLPFWRVERAEVDASIGEGLVGGCKHGEGAGALEGGQQVRLNHGGDQ